MNIGHHRRVAADETGIGQAAGAKAEADILVTLQVEGVAGISFERTRAGVTGPDEVRLARVDGKGVHTLGRGGNAEGQGGKQVTEGSNAHECSWRLGSPPPAKGPRANMVCYHRNQPTGSIPERKGSYLRPSRTPKTPAALFHKGRTGNGTQGQRQPSQSHGMSPGPRAACLVLAPPIAPRKYSFIII